MLTHLGTFDVENYGDLLYPLVFQHLLAKRNLDLPVRQYSLLPGHAPQQAGFETDSIQSLFDSPPPDPVTMVIGGGDLLRTDSDIIAHHYGRNSRTSYKSLRRSIGVRGYAGYVLHDKLPRLEPSGFYARNFRTRWMNYPGAGPFIIDPEDLPPQSVVAYVSCGVPHDFAASEIDNVKRALDGASFIWLRDEQSAEKLRRAGITRALHVAPDLTIVLSDQFEREEQVRRGRQILAQFGITSGRPLMCFQSQPYPGFVEEDILSQLNQYRERAGAEVVLLPIGYCHGDHEFLQSLAQRSHGMLKYADVYSVSDIMAIIAACDLFVGTSLHGNITAFSFGIPHLFGPLPVAKAEGFLGITNLPAELKLQSWNELNHKTDLAEELGPAFFSARAREAKAAVYETVDQLMPDLLKCRVHD